MGGCDFHGRQDHAVHVQTKGVEAFLKVGIQQFVAELLQIRITGRILRNVLLSIAKSIVRQK